MTAYRNYCCRLAGTLETGAGADFLTAPDEPLTPAARQSVVLFSANIGQWLQLGDALANPQITQRKAAISL